MRYRHTNNGGVSPVIGVILMVAITVILSGVILVGVGAIGNSTNENASAGYSVDYNSESEMVVQLTSKQQADKVEVVSALGTRYKLSEVGDTQAVLNTDSGQTPTVVGTYEGKETVLGQVQPRSFTADRIVSADGSIGSYTTIQGAVDASSSGDIIIVKKSNYSTSGITVDKSVTIIGEHGTVVTDTAANGIATIDITSSGATVSNLSIDSQGNEDHAIESASSDVTAVSVSTTNTNASGVELTGSNSTVTDSSFLLAGTVQSTSSSDSVELKEITFSSKKYSTDGSLNNKVIVGEGTEIMKVDLTVTVTQPTKYYGNGFYFEDTDGTTRVNVRKANNYNGSNRKTKIAVGGTKVSNGNYTIAEEGTTSVTVNVKYDSGTFKVLYNGSVVDSKDSLGPIYELIWQNGDGKSSITFDGSVYVKK